MGVIIERSINTLHFLMRISQIYKCKKLARDYGLPSPYKRIYHYHIRKTGGTSLNYLFLSSGNKRGEDIYKKTCEPGNPPVINNNKVFVGWNKHLIERGQYFYAFSHLASHELSLPDGTFTITCLRDPVKRILSLYKMLLGYKINNVSHPGMKTQGKWLGNSFSDFLSSIPKDDLLRQLYMFSRAYDISESFDNIINCSYFFFTEDFAHGIEELSSKLRIPLEAIHVRKSSFDFTLKPEDIDRLRNMLEPEYILLGKLKEYKGSQSEDDK
jgi:hypothetical protein